MKLRLFLLLVPVILKAQDNLAFEAYKVWDEQHPRSDARARNQSLLEVSAEWVAKWPDSQLAWMQRRDAVLSSKNATPELWKQVDEKLISLHPPHTFAMVAAYDWVTAKVNLKDAEALLAAEIAWQDSKSRPILVSPTLDLLIDEANQAANLFEPLSTMASAQILLKEFDAARATIARIHSWLNGDFARYFDQDPLETVGRYQSTYYTLSAQLAEAEGRHLDALTFYHSAITNPWYRREYNGFVKTTQAIWTEAGGTKEGWAEFSKVEPLPAGAPSGNRGVTFLPWVSLHYKLPDGMNFQRKDFEGKTTLVYLWASWCAPCWNQLPNIQALYDGIKDRSDIRVITLSADEDPEKLEAFMKEKGYTFPVTGNLSYIKQVLPNYRLGQQWIVDRTGTIRLQRTSNEFGGRKQAFVDESLYKLTQLAK